MWLAGILDFGPWLALCTVFFLLYRRAMIRKVRKHPNVLKGLVNMRRVIACMSLGGAALLTSYMVWLAINGKLAAVFVIVHCGSLAALAGFYAINAYMLAELLIVAMIALSERNTQIADRVLASKVTREVNRNRWLFERLARRRGHHLDGLLTDVVP